MTSFIVRESPAGSQVSQVCFTVSFTTGLSVHVRSKKDTNRLAIY